MMIDSDSGDRSRGSVTAKIIKPIILDKDLPGHNYHFWGYLLHAKMGQTKYIKYYSASTYYERLKQKDIPDWLVDKLALNMGK